MSPRTAAPSSHLRCLARPCMSRLLSHGFLAHIKWKGQPQLHGLAKSPCWESSLNQGGGNEPTWQWHLSPWLRANMKPNLKPQIFTYNLIASSGPFSVLHLFGEPQATADASAKLTLSTPQSGVVVMPKFTYKAHDCVPSPRYTQTHLAS